MMVFSNECNLQSKTVEEVHLPINTRMQIDGIEMMNMIDATSIPCVFFDPQYRGILDKMNYGNEGARQIGRHDLPQMTDPTIIKFIKEINRILVPSGHLFLWVDKFHLCDNSALNWLVDTDLHIVDLITWNKERMGMGYRSRRISEYLLIIQKMPLKAKGVWCIHNIPDVWDEKVDRKHPHCKPIKLQSALISAVTRPGDIIVDPAAGSYSTMDSALAVNRNFIGCDLI